MSDRSQKGIDDHSFRKAMRHVPTVVTVLTMGDDEGIAGITIGSFVSLSLDPPLICFNVQRSSSIHNRIVGVSSYVVHVLRENQSDLSDRFATPRLSEEEQFRGLVYEVEKDGPVLSDALVTFICSAENVLPGGDHSILVGRVREVREGKQGRPVVFHQRAYWGIGQQVAERPTTSDD